MKIKVLYFASLRDRVGAASSVEEAPPGATVAFFRETLRRRAGLDAPGCGAIRAAVNDEFCPDPHVLSEGDELAWIPAVSGGR